jgi:hypothetical protein
MPCSTVSSSGSSIRSSVYYTVWITCSLPTCEHFHTILKISFLGFLYQLRSKQVQRASAQWRLYNSHCWKHSLQYIA